VLCFRNGIIQFSDQAAVINLQQDGNYLFVYFHFYMDWCFARKGLSF